MTPSTDFQRHECEKSRRVKDPLHELLNRTTPLLKVPTQNFGVDCHLYYITELKK